MKTQKNATILCAVLAVVLLAAALSQRERERRRLAELALLHAPIPGTLQLNDRQKAEVTPLKGEWPKLFRYKDARGFWQVAVGKSPPASPEAPLLLGLLSPDRKGGDYDAPIQLCAFAGFEGKTTGVDAALDCSRNGVPVGKKALGYLSEKLRPGHRLLFQCLSRRHGRYPSLNSRCESIDDSVLGLLGAIRAQLE